MTIESFLKTNGGFLFNIMVEGPGLERRTLNLEVTGLNPVGGGVKLSSGLHILGCALILVKSLGSSH